MAEQKRNSAKLNWRWLWVVAAFAIPPFWLVHMILREATIQEWLRNISISVFRDGGDSQTLKPDFIRINLDEEYAVIQTHRHSALRVVVLLSNLHSMIQNAPPCAVMGAKPRISYSLESSWPDQLKSAWASMHSAGPTLVIMDFAERDPDEITVECGFHAEPIKKSFTDREYYFTDWPMFPVNLEGPLQIIRSQLHSQSLSEDAAFVKIESDKQNFRILGEPITGQPSNVRLLNAGLVGVLWTDEKYATLRDILLLFAGALMGTAGAAIVEILRPKLDGS